jgi:lysophospholipase L1-like esterase
MNYSIALLLILGVLIGWGIYVATTFKNARTKAQTTLAATTPYNYATQGTGESMLVLGDSTAYGVGAATPEETTAGHVSQSLGLIYVENRAVSGARTRDLFEQFSQARLPRYDIALIQVGANDIIYGTSVARASKELDQFLALVTAHASTTVLLTSGDIGTAPLWPWPLNHVYTWRTKALRKEFMRISNAYAVKYIDIFS